MRKKLKYSLITIFIAFLIMNILIAIHAYRFSHYNDEAPVITASDILETSLWDKAKLALSGVDIPKPRTQSFPESYSDIEIETKRGKLAGWILRTDSIKRGTILIFHGYIEEKSVMLKRANELLQMGYDIGIIDFHGSGDSSGNQVTLGNNEADDVIATYKYFHNELEEKQIILLGFSMGSVAIMKAIYDEPMDLEAIILEAPYSTLETTIANRCELFGIPKQPAATFFTFWLGAVNGFNGFSFKPIEYARKIDIPTLLLCGAKDPYISEKELQSIYNAIASQRKAISLLENSAHGKYLLNDKDKWRETITEFLSSQTENK